MEQPHDRGMLPRVFLKSEKAVVATRFVAKRARLKRVRLLGIPQAEESPPAPLSKGGEEARLRRGRRGPSRPESPPAPLVRGEKRLDLFML